MKKWLVRSAIALGVLFLVVMGVGIYAANRFEPFILEQAKLWMSTRFDSEVEFTSLRVSFPMQSPVRVLMSMGKGGRIRIKGQGIQFRHKGRKDVPPMFVMREFSCDVDLGTILARPVIVKHLDLKGMEINLPPKGERPKINIKPKTEGNAAAAAEPDAPKVKQPPVVVFERIIADGTKLVILPKDAWKDPLIFEIAKLTLTSATAGQPMGYNAQLTNAKPPGIIVSRGHFGPWNGPEPGESPLDGTYVFAGADLGVFKGIGGKLNSTGKFQGRLNYILADGEARVPDFSLDIANHAMNLQTKFHAIIDGTNGNTVLDPVEAQLGKSRFVCKGEVAKRQGDSGKRILLDVDMPDARLEDVLFLAMKGDRPFMRGPLKLKTQLEIPPGKVPISQKLKLHKGQFQIIDAKFTSATIQEKIDGFSRRGQGNADAKTGEEVPVRMKGVFELSDGKISFSTLSFEIPGALVNLAGHYGFRADEIDFLGEVKLDAKVSALFSGWKKIALKPVDPFFSKRGAGTYLPIEIKGSRDKPEYGLSKTDKVDARLNQ